MRCGSRPRVALGLGGRGDAAAQLDAQAPSGPGTTAGTCRVQRVQGVERAAAVDAGAHVALAVAPAGEHDQPAQPDGDRRRVLVDHPESKTMASRTALVGPGQGARPRRRTPPRPRRARARRPGGARRRLRACDVQQWKEVALVVGRAARVDPASRRRARTGRCPCRRVADGLHVVVAVDEHGRRASRAARSSPTASGLPLVATTRASPPVALDALDHPRSGTLEVRGLAATRRDEGIRSQFEKVVEQALVHARHQQCRCIPVRWKQLRAAG